jgi:hypothetical protein
MTRNQFLATGLVLTLAVLVIGSVRFARYDWHGLPLDRAPMERDVRVSPDCLEKIRPYVTESGREIGPIVVDEQQYLALVAYYRGVPRDQLQAECLYDPFTNRSGMSWVAHWLPFEEGLSLGIVNLGAMVVATWFVLAALRAQGFDPRVVLAVSALFAIGWNTFYFSSGLLIEPGVLALISLAWWLLSIRRPWFLLPILLLGYPLKETIGILVPVTAAWAWQEHRAARRGGRDAIALSVAAAACFVIGVAFWRGALPQPDVAWEVTPDLSAVVHNLTEVVSLASFLIGVVPLYGPAVLQFVRMVRSEGWLRSAVDPAVVGAVLAAGIGGWSFITVDFTPRVVWIGFPFAATLTARWLCEGRPAEWLGRVRMPAALVGGPSASAPTA